MLSTRQIWDRYGTIYINPTKAGHWNVEARRNSQPQNRSYSNLVPRTFKRRVWINEIEEAVTEAMNWLQKDWIQESDR